ncbi:MAG: hypothetical protein ACFFEF_02665 [Candidatus Thorarchaeota archaeon]
MKGVLKSKIRFDVLLFICSALMPSIVETEAFGAGELVVLDAVSYHATIASRYWAFVWCRNLTLGGAPDSLELYFPYVSSLMTNGLWLIGLLATAVVFLVLNGKSNRWKGILILVVIMLLPFIVPGVCIYRQEIFYTYQRKPLPIPQIIGLIILIITRNRIISM